MWKEYRLTIWVALVLSTILIAWMLTLSWPAIPGEPRTGLTVPEWVNPRVTSTATSP